MIESYSIYSIWERMVSSGYPTIPWVDWYIDSKVRRGCVTADTNIKRIDVRYIDIILVIIRTTSER